VTATPLNVSGSAPIDSTTHTPASSRSASAATSDFGRTSCAELLPPGTEGDAGAGPGADGVPQPAALARGPDLSRSAPPATIVDDSGHQPGTEDRGERKLVPGST
jgi:hypothetical protein